VVGIDSKTAHGGIRLVPAGTTLHARTGAEVAREARSPAGMTPEEIVGQQDFNLYVSSRPLKMSAFGTKRTLVCVPSMSALEVKRAPARFAIFGFADGKR
jgi:hypothetical protein